VIPPALSDEFPPHEEVGVVPFFFYHAKDLLPPPPPQSPSDGGLLEDRLRLTLLLTFLAPFCGRRKIRTGMGSFLPMFLSG